MTAAALVDYFEKLTPADLSRLGEFYATDAWFKDPFNEVRGLPAITGIFEHMFKKLDRPQFVVHEQLAQGDQAFLVWDLEFGFPGQQVASRQRIQGASHLRFDTSGRVSRHRDYWDAAEELYEKLPVLGSAMRWLKRRAAH